MALFFNRVTKSELSTRFSHYGWFCGLVPVYVGNLDSGCPELEARNGIPEFYFTCIEGMFGLFCWAASFVNPEFEPMFPIQITGEIKQ